MNQQWLCPGTSCTNHVSGTHLCPDCVEFIGVMLSDLGPLWRHARTMLPRQSAAESERISTTIVGSSAPLDLGVLELLDQTVALLAYWADVVARRRDDPRDPPTSIEESFSDDRAYLVMFYWNLYDSELLTDFYNALYRLRRSLVAVAGEAAPTRRMTTPCFTCGMTSVVIRHGSDYVVCLTCGSRWGHSAYRGLTISATTSTNDR